MKTNKPLGSIHFYKDDVFYGVPLINRIGLAVYSLLPCKCETPTDYKYCQISELKKYDGEAYTDCKLKSSQFLCLDVKDGDPVIEASRGRKRCGKCFRAILTEDEKKSLIEFENRPKGFISKLIRRFLK